MNPIDHTKYVSGQLSELSRLIRSWHLPGLNSKETVQPLAGKLLNRLYDGQTETKIKGILVNELSVTYGLFSTEFDADRFYQGINSFWENTYKPIDRLDDRSFSK